MARTNRDKRRNETHLQWRQRLDRIEEVEGPRVDPTPETIARGKFDRQTILHIETLTNAEVMRRRPRSAFYRMHGAGQITTEQYEASIEIAAAMEVITRAVSVSGASLNARVDNSGGARDLLVERLYVVRMQAAYTRWRSRLPRKHNLRALMLEMILHDSVFAARAKQHGVRWWTARTALIDSLDRWIGIREVVWKEIDERDVAGIHARLGGGALI